MLTPNAIVADHFPRRLMAPFSRHATRWAPNFGWFSSRASSAGLLRAKQKAAKIMNGTVGNKGREAMLAAIEMATLRALVDPPDEGASG